MNIWHKLAEEALNGVFQSPVPVSVCGRLNFDYPGIEGAKLGTHFLTCKRGIQDKFYDATPEEQCLFLLFCGESYESV
jgi:hypothetical protein